MSQSSVDSTVVKRGRGRPPKHKKQLLPQINKEDDALQRIDKLMREVKGHQEYVHRQLILQQLERHDNARVQGEALILKSLRPNKPQGVSSADGFTSDSTLAETESSISRWSGKRITRRKALHVPEKPSRNEAPDVWRWLIHPRKRMILAHSRSDAILPADYMSATHIIPVKRSIHTNDDLRLIRVPCIDEEDVTQGLSNSKLADILFEKADALHMKDQDIVEHIEFLTVVVKRYLEETKLDPLDVIHTLLLKAEQALSLKADANASSQAGSHDDTDHNQEQNHTALEATQDEILQLRKSLPEKEVDPETVAYIDAFYDAFVEKTQVNLWHIFCVGDLLTESFAHLEMPPPVKSNPYMEELCIICHVPFCPHHNVQMPERVKASSHAKNKLKAQAEQEDSDPREAGSRGAFVPCNHDGPCSSGICTCYDTSIPCEKQCRCSVTCSRRWAGCQCKRGKVSGKICSRDTCACSKAGRECDPDICKQCLSKEQLDPTNRGDEEVKELCCQNVFLQKGESVHTKIGSTTMPFQGYGLFTLEPIKRDAFIGEYKGEIITDADADLRGKAYDVSEVSYLFGINETHVIDATRFGNKMRYLNHSKIEPNIKAMVMLVDGVHRVGFWALYDIDAGEELLFDYQKEKKSEFVAVERPGALERRKARERERKERIVEDEPRTREVSETPEIKLKISEAEKENTKNENVAQPEDIVIPEAPSEKPKPLPPKQLLSREPSNPEPIFSLPKIAERPQSARKTVKSPESRERMLKRPFTTMHKLSLVGIGNRSPDMQERVKEADEKLKSALSSSDREPNSREESVASDGSQKRQRRFPLDN